MTALGLVFLVFLLMKLVPGDVISQLIDQSAGHNKSRIDELRSEFGLDLPWYNQFFNWLYSIIQGNLGISWRSRVPIQEILFSRLAVTLELAIISTLVSSLIIGKPVIPPPELILSLFKITLTAKYIIPKVAPSVIE